jgi:hypothetical protein
MAPIEIKRAYERAHAERWQENPGRPAVAARPAEGCGLSRSLEQGSCADVFTQSMVRSSRRPIR